MRKQGKNRKNKPTATKRSKPNADQQVSKGAEVLNGRRHFLNQMRTAAIAVPVVGVLGYYSITAIQASIRETDLTRIGNGRPAIVQIHDPQCGYCRTLQSQTRGVLDSHSSEKFEYLVANIKTKKGSDLAVKYSAPHVTLLLFDPDGKMVQIVRGPTSTSYLENAIANHIGKYR